MSLLITRCRGLIIWQPAYKVRVGQCSHPVWTSCSRLYLVVAWGSKSLLLGSELMWQDNVNLRRRDSSSSDTRLDFKRIHYDDELFVLISWTQTPINYRWLPPATPLPHACRPSPRQPVPIHLPLTSSGAAFVRRLSIVKLRVKVDA